MKQGQGIEIDGTVVSPVSYGDGPLKDEGAGPEIPALSDGELPEEVLRDLCGRSYALAVEKLPKYVRRELAEQPAES